MAGRALDVPAGLCVGYLLDRAVGDPRRWHPVAGLGRAIGRLERAVYADSRAVGVGFAATSVYASIALGVGVDRAARRVDSSPVRIAAVAVATWAVLGGTTLNRVGREVADDLSVDDIDDALAIAARHGCHPLRGVANYQDVYKLTYVRGPSGIIVMFAQDLTK